MLRFRHFVEGVDKSADRSGQLCWSPGDLSFDGPEQDAIGEERAPSYINKFDVSHMKNNARDTVLSNDELQSHSEHRSSFTEHHTKALVDYKQGSDYDYNDHLRENHDPETNKIVLKKNPPVHGSFRGSFKDKISHMDHITSHQTTEPISTYRGFSEGFRVDHLKPGDEFTDHGYTGTSLHKSIAGGFAGENKELSPLKFKTIAKINIPTGTKAHYLDHPDHNVAGLQTFRGEHEVTLQRGTRFQVQKHTLHQDPNTREMYHITHLNVIGQHPTDIQYPGE